MNVTENLNSMKESNVMEINVVVRYINHTMLDYDIVFQPVIEVPKTKISILRK